MTAREQLVQLVESGRCEWPGVDVRDIPLFSDAKVQRLLAPRPQNVKVTREVISAYNRRQWTYNDSYNEAHGQPTTTQREYLDHVKKFAGKRTISMLDVNMYNKAR